MIRRIARRGVVVAALSLAGCQGAPPAEPVVSVAVDVGGDVAAEARAAMVRGDWPVAARLLRTALTREPQSLNLHYRLAISATHLDAHEEAVREFQWVEAQAPADSEEASVARAWLASPPRQGARARAPQDAGGFTDVPPAIGALSGHVLWAEPGGSSQPRNRQLLMLIGLPGTPTKGQRYRLRTDQNGRYTFKDVTAGPYQLTDAIAGQPTWRQRVVVEPGRETVIDLSRSNAAPGRDDFPAGGAPPSPGAPATGRR